MIKNIIPDLKDLLSPLSPEGQTDEPAIIGHPLFVFLGWTVVLVILGIMSVDNYLLFHALAEIFSIIIAGAVFTVAWNSRKFSANGYLLIVGTSLLFAGVIDFFHIMAYKGMGVFPDVSTNVATQLWLAARYLQSLSLLAATLWLFKKDNRQMPAGLVFVIYMAVTALLLLSILFWRVFPVSYVDGLGLTPFKKISEYLISAILLLSLFPLAKKSKKFAPSVFWLIVWSIVAMVLSELAFTFYTDPYGFLNKAGHFLKIVAFYLIYRAIVVSNFKDPFAFLFKDLKQKETALAGALKESQANSESLKIQEQLYHDALFYAQGIVDTVTQPLIVVDEKLKIDSANRSFYDFFRSSPEEIEKEFLPKICDCEWDNPELIELINKSFATNKGFSGFEVAIDCRRVGQKTLLFSGEKLKRPGNWPPLLLISVEDITERKQTEEKISHLASFPQLNPNPILELDENGKIIFANPAAKTVSKDLGIKDGPEIFLPADISDLMKTLKQVEETQIFYREIQVKNLTFAENIHLSKSLNAARIYAVNITQRRQAEEKLRETKEYLEKLINHANAPIVVWDPEMKIVQFNHAFEQSTGYRSSEVIGQSLDILFPPDTKKESLEKILLMAEGEYWKSVEIPILLKDGSNRVILWNSANIYNDYYDESKKNLIATIAQGQDITELKRIDSAKTEFISLAAHQLRTPLATIRLTAEMLMRGVAGETTQEVRQYLESITEDITGMTEMIETFLNISRIEMGTFPIEPKPTDLIKTVDDIVENIRPQIKNKKITLRKNYCADSFIMELDQRALRITLENLISNALKYTDEKGYISVGVSQKDNETIIKVADNGWGIPKNQQNRIFEKLYRATNVQGTKAEGSGLGLYMVKSVMEQVGGRLWFESKKDQGSTFYIGLPREGMKKKALAN